MYMYFQPKISVAQEEADIEEFIDKEYELREQEKLNYYKQMEEDYYRYFEDWLWLFIFRGRVETDAQKWKYIFGGLSMENKSNNVHFYVARDNDGTLYLYMGKPFREDTMFISSRGVTLACNSNLELYGLNENDYAKLRWEDEPVEVFLNMED